LPQGGFTHREKPVLTPSFQRLVALCCGAVLLAGSAARAAVERVEILSRKPCGEICGRAPGTPPYEELRGRATIALDPNAVANARVTDLKLAPRDARGRVVFTTDFFVRRPVQPHADSTLLYDVNNRGEPIADAFDWAQAPSGGSFINISFLARHGFTVVSSAWAWDVTPGKGDGERLVFQPPIASDHGKTITGPVANEFVVEASAPEADFVGIKGRAYPWARADDPAAVLTARRRPEDPRVPLSRSAWHVLPAAEGAAPTRIALDGGFKPGVIYELTYLARDPYVVAAGPIAIRDLLSYLRSHPLEGAPAPRRVLLFGDSQTGRLIQQMLYEGFDLDEQGRLAFDGALAVVGGAGRGSFNTRFGYPTRAASLVLDRSYPTDIFPFATGPTRDLVSGATASMYDRAHAADGSAPKLFIVNKSTEFWGRAASLIQTTPDGAADAPQDPNARLYLLAGLQHFAGGQPERAPLTSCTVPTLELPYLRAMLVNLDDWVRAGTSPPPSADPGVANGQLVTLADYGRLFPKGVGLTPPSIVYVPQRMDFGPRYAGTGVIDKVPPTAGAPYAVRVPRPDADGSDVGGVRPVELRAPLGTFTGWNQMSDATGFGWALDRFQGSFAPFARTEAERRAAGDPRPSLEARYPTREAFVAAARKAAAEAVADRTLLAEDVDGVVGAQAGMYDRVMALTPGEQSCKYLWPPHAQT
jgi:hypothetical protein